MKHGLKTTCLAAVLTAGVMIPVSFAAAQTPAAVMPSRPAPQQTEFRVDYSGKLFLLPIGNLTVAAKLNDYGYSMRTDMRTSGFGKLSKDGGLWSTSIGYYGPEKVQPREHIIQKLNKKNRRVEINYDRAGNPTASIVPKFGSMGVPPATNSERRDGVDAMSGILQMMMKGHRYGDTPCTGIVPIFDGKQRYNLRLESAGTARISQPSYRGETVKCHVYMETVSGYDPEDLLTEEEASTPLEVYLANYEEAALWVPVRFDYRISGIKVNIKATRIDVKTSG